MHAAGVVTGTGGVTEARENKESEIMKIAIPVNAKSMESAICQSFGRAPYYLFYDGEEGTSEFKENSACASQGGAGIKAAQLIVDEKADVLLTPRCGENAAQVLRGAGVKMYKTMNDSIRENIQAFKEGKLSELRDIHPGHHRG